MPPRPLSPPPPRGGGAGPVPGPRSPGRAGWRGGGTFRRVAGTAVAVVTGPCRRAAVRAAQFPRSGPGGGGGGGGSTPSGAAGGPGCGAVLCYRPPILHSSRPPAAVGCAGGTGRALTQPRDHREDNAGRSWEHGGGDPRPSRAGGNPQGPGAQARKHSKLYGQAWGKDRSARGRRGGSPGTAGPRYWQCKVRGGPGTGPGQEERRGPVRPWVPLAAEARSAIGAAGGGGPCRARSLASLQ